MDMRERGAPVFIATSGTVTPGEVISSGPKYITARVGEKKQRFMNGPRVILAHEKGPGMYLAGDRKTAEKLARALGEKQNA